MTVKCLAESFALLIAVARGFDIRKPALIVVFFHGNGATLSRDVLDRQQVAAQLGASNLNAVLVAPQFAVDAADSSAGRFWQRGVFKKFVDEATRKLALQYHDRRVESAFKPSKVVLVAYSGGYLPASWSLAELLGYVRTWSAVQAMERARGKEPYAGFARALTNAWGDPAAHREVRWDLAVRCGRL